MYEFVLNDKRYKVPDNAFVQCQEYQISHEKAQELFALAIDSGVPVTQQIASKILRAEHTEKGKKFIEEFAVRGAIKGAFKMKFNEENKQDLISRFRQDNRFHGRVPRIIDSITRVSDFMIKNMVDNNVEGQSHEDGVAMINADLVSKFSIPTMQRMLANKCPQTLAVYLYMNFTPEKCLQITSDIDNTHNIVNLLITADKEHDQMSRDAATWLAEHLETDKEFSKKIVKNADRLGIDTKDTVDKVEVKLTNLKSLKEVERIEKQYKKAGFKLKNCTCELKGVGRVVEDNRYMAYIMQPTDERQIMLGYDTHCCQTFEGIGESAMMHGLVNPKAGFLAIEEKSTGKIKAQAEIWEENENSLVFDNIEFANDADIGLYKDILSKWLQTCEYDNVKMGAGYNELKYEGNFRSAGGVKPSVTPYEIFVICYEQESEAPIFKSEEEAKAALDSGEVTYFDYVYCDSENESYWMKCGGTLEPFFQSEAERIQSRIEQDLQRIDNENIRVCIGSLIEEGIMTPNSPANHEEPDDPDSGDLGDCSHEIEEEEELPFF